MTVEDITFMMSAKNVCQKKRGNLEVTNDFLPQQEILFDPNTKLFISHCGQNSLTEAIYAGVPLICIPSGGDQFYNSSLVEYLGIGKYVLLTFKDEEGNGQRNENFQSDFQNALSDILLYKIDNYVHAINQLRGTILNNVGAKGTFLQTISNVIGD
uniref:UDP-glucuronosyltransferase n=1 Tax=Meloidogyne enterolobii TaxID=390850 RepID=A0A6V7WW96_MELEN|nr:unnamed protein product [Meloidogyne enterolobii]